MSSALSVVNPSVRGPTPARASLVRCLSALPFDEYEKQRRQVPGFVPSPPLRNKLADSLPPAGALPAAVSGAPSVLTRRKIVAMTPTSLEFTPEFTPGLVVRSGNIQDLLQTISERAKEAAEKAKQAAEKAKEVERTEVNKLCQEIRAFDAWLIAGPQAGESQTQRLDEACDRFKALDKRRQEWGGKGYQIPYPNLHIGRDEKTVELIPLSPPSIKEYPNPEEALTVEGNKRSPYTEGQRRVAEIASRNAVASSSLVGGNRSALYGPEDRAKITQLAATLAARDSATSSSSLLGGNQSLVYRAALPSGNSEVTSTSSSSVSSLVGGNRSALYTDVDRARIKELADSLLKKVQ